MVFSTLSPGVLLTDSLSHACRPGVVTVLLILLSATPCAHADDDDFEPTTSIFGNFQFDGYLGDTSLPDTDEATFMIRRARLGFRGQATKAISYNFMAALDAGNSETVGSDVRAFNAFIDYRFSRAATVRLGQFKYDFDLEGRKSASQLPLPFRAATTAVARSLGRDGGMFRDVGIQLHGRGNDGPGWSYAVGLVNGNGTNRRDDNDHKDLYARGVLGPMAGVKVGTAFYAGRAGDLELREDLWTIDLQYEQGALGLYGAYYSGDFENDSAPDSEPSGWYLVAGYEISPNAEVVVRVQDFEQDSALTDTGFDSVDVGFNYYLGKTGRWSGTRVSVMYMSRSAENAASSRIWQERGATVVGDDVEDVLVARFTLPLSIRLK